ncbi:hypothetical protein BJX76DRAFT_331704 [Aspergillus varians]
MHPKTVAVTALRQELGIYIPGSRNLASTKQYVRRSNLPLCPLLLPLLFSSPFSLLLFLPSICNATPVARELRAKSCVGFSQLYDSISLATSQAIPLRPSYVPF